jgi:Transglutaminase-like superfamily
VPSDELATYAMREFAGVPNGHIRVSMICGWIYQNIEYRPGSSDFETATEALIQRAGVCRDFVHLGIAFCRALGIPARFVTCYAYGLSPSDFHAVFEAYLDGRRWLFDGTRQAALDGLVRMQMERPLFDLIATIIDRRRLAPSDLHTPIALLRYARPPMLSGGVLSGTRFCARG